MLKRFSRYFCLFLLLLSDTFSNHAIAAPPLKKDSLVLTLASRHADSKNFYLDVLSRACEAQGINIKINYLGELNLQRQLKYFEQGKLSLIWRMSSPLRDTKYHRVNTPLTDGKIAQRLLFINPQRQPAFDGIDSIDDFKRRQLTGAFGENWFDADVWRYNQLSYIEFSGDWSKIYHMLLSDNRGFQYFSRSITEITKESEHYPALVIEPNLLLEFDNDMFFYTHKNDDALHQTLSNALIAAQKSGLLEDIIIEHFGDLDTLYNTHMRTRIKLNTPLLFEQ